MKKALIVVILLIAGVIGLGFYLDWFSISTSATTARPTSN